MSTNEEDLGGGDTIHSRPVTEAPYYDRSTGLVVFGILTILLGCLCALLVFFMLVGVVMSATTAAPSGPVSLRSILPGMFIYVILAVALVWLGIGSIKARRWARALLLIFSWSWLVVGILAMVMMAVVMPKILANMPSPAGSGHAATPAALVDTMMAMMFLIDGFIFVVLPGIWTFFYNSRHVKLTCEWRDPVTRWTDACPLPVLGFCIWSIFSVGSMLIMPIAGMGVAPFFGMFLTGIPGTIYYLVIAALWAYAAGLMYQLDRRGWWLIVITLGVFTVSGMITYARHDVMEMYQLMGYPAAQTEQIKKTGLLNGNYMMWMTGVFMAPFLAYLLFIKRYFR